MSRMRRSAIAAALTGLVLTGCSGSGEPEVESTFTPSPTSPSSSAAPTAEPTAASLGPEETVRAWVEAQNLALSSGSVGELKELSHKECRNCFATFIEPISDVYDAGGRYETKGWTVISTNLRGGNRPEVAVDVAVRIAGGVTHASATADPVSYPVDKRILEFRVAGGQVTRVEFVP